MEYAVISQITVEDKTTKNNINNSVKLLVKAQANNIKNIAPNGIHN